MPIKLQKRKTASQSLGLIYGIGRITTKKILGRIRLHPKASFNSFYRRRREVEPILKKQHIGFACRLRIFRNMLREVYHATLKGQRYVLGLPVHGQRTHSNGKTSKRRHQQGTFFGFPMIKRKDKNVSKIRIRTPVGKGKAKQKTNKKKK